MLYLLPNVLDVAQNHELFLPSQVAQIVGTLDGLIAESEKAGRAFLKRFPLKKPLQEMPVLLLNEHTKPDELEELTKPLKKGEIWGLVSDAGLPCIADPGSTLVAKLHRLSIPCTAISGPCSITLALMMSGFSGQRFSFHGYLPKEEKERKRQLQHFEEDARLYLRTHMFIEVPYRSHTQLKELLELLKPDTMLCLAWDLTLATQGVISKSVKEWKALGELPDLQKKPCVFLVSYCKR